MAKFFNSKKAEEKRIQSIKLNRKIKLKTFGKIAWECLQAAILCYLLYKAI